MILCIEVTVWMDSDVRRRSLAARLTPRARSTSALVVYTDPILPSTVGRTLTVWPLASSRLLSWACCSYSTLKLQMLGSRASLASRSASSLPMTPMWDLRDLGVSCGRQQPAR